MVIPGEHLQHLGCKEPHPRAGWKPGAQSSFLFFLQKQNFALFFWHVLCPKTLQHCPAFTGLFQGTILEDKLTQINK